MHNFLGTCLVLVLLGGGFAITGDLGRLAARFQRVIEASDVPDGEAPVQAASAPTPGGGGFPGMATVRPSCPGPDAVDVSTLAPGTRIAVWLGHHDPSSIGAGRRIALDIVDPGTREALMSESCQPTPGLPPQAPAPPRRVRVVGSGRDGLIARGGMLEIESHGIAGATGHETIGPVVALDVIR